MILPSSSTPKVPHHRDGRLTSVRSLNVVQAFGEHHGTIAGEVDDFEGVGLPEHRKLAGHVLHNGIRSGEGGHSHVLIDGPRLRGELTAIFKERTRKEWADFFIASDIAGAPAFLGADLFDDDHAKVRRLVYDEAQSDGTSQRLMGTCIKTKRIRAAGST